MKKSMTFRIPEMAIPLTAVQYEGENDDPPKYEFDLAKALADPATKAVMEEWAERTIVQPIKAKNTELLGKLTGYKYKAEDGTEHYLDPQEALNAIKKVKDGTSPDVQTAIAEAVNAANQRSQQQIDALTAQLTDARGETTKERARRFENMVGNALTTALLESGVKPGKKHLHERYLRDFIEVVDDNGVEKITVMDEKDRSKAKYGKNGLMTLAEFISEYKVREGVAEDWGATKPGGGSNNGRPGSRTVAIPEDLSPTEKMKLLRRSQRA